MNKFKAAFALPGLAACAALGVAAFFLGRALPVVGGPVFAILGGAVIALVRRPALLLRSGIKIASRSVLQGSIVLLGATLPLRDVLRTGVQSLPVLIGSAVITLAAAYVFGRLLLVPRDLRRLLGAGTMICGGSAIAALSNAIVVSETDVAYAISTVFLFNVVAVLLFPPAGHALGLSQHAFGLWAGTAINDTSSVVAAGYSYGHDAGTYAIVVKLTRTLLIVPLVLFYAGKRAFAARAGENPIPWRSIFPWFILWFACTAALNTFGAVPAAWHPAITQTALLLICVALAGVGLSVDPRAIRAAGPRPLLLGLVLWMTIAVVSLAIARVAHIA